MSIQKTDIKLMASQRLTDYYDGGGQMTGSEIIDGQVNNLFPDISRLDRVYGRVSLRKAFPAVMTDNTDMYYGCHVIITDPPDDDNVHTTLFTRDDFYDQRDDAKDRIESYVSIANELLWRPLNDQLEGQRAITCFAKPGTTRPEVGDTIVLKNAVNGDQQYVRITSLEAASATFAYVNYGNFTVEVLTLGLSAALQHTFPGIEATPYTTKATTRIHATIVADASSYYGVSRLAQPATAGDMTFWLNSIYNQLVPTSQIETALVDQLMSRTVSLIAVGAPVSGASYRRSNSANLVHLPSGVLPGSLMVNVAGYALRDLRGTLVAVGNDGGYSGSIDYSSGQLTIEKSGTWSATVAVGYQPAVPVSQAQVTREISIELANRAYNYTPMLVGPLPSPGSITVSYMAQGKWYDLHDDGQGVFVANEQGIGTGTVDYASGSCIITLGALPDVGSSIILQWGHAIDLHDRSASLPATAAPIVHSLPHQGIQPGSLTISWNDGSAKTATDQGDGSLSGDAIGAISYAAGEIAFIPTTLPASATEYSISYQQETPDSASVSASVADQQISLTVPDAPLRPKSVRLDYQVEQIVAVAADGTPSTSKIWRSVVDDGAGNLKRDGLVVGTINYTTGAATFTGLSEYTAPVYDHAADSGTPVDARSGGRTYYILIVTSY